jgi:ArsR family transcriptional regulator
MWKAVKGMQKTGQNRIDYEEKAALLKALANPLRLEIVHRLLLVGCRNVGCMERRFEISQSCVSQHLQKLRMAGVVTAERNGNEVFYHVASQEVARLIAALFDEKEEDYVL